MIENSKGIFTERKTIIRPLRVIAIAFLIAVTTNSAYAEESFIQSTLDAFFETVGSFAKNSVGDDFSTNQTERINETIDSGVEAGSVSVEVFRVFHHFTVSGVLMIASLMGIEIGETIAYIIGVIIVLSTVGGLLRKMVFDSWKIVLAILGVLALLLFTGVTFIDV